MKRTLLIIAGWHHIGLQPLIQVGTYEDAQEVLPALLNSLLLKIPRTDSEQLITKFQGQLACSNTRDCSQTILADHFVGQSDASPFLHVIGVPDNSNTNPVNIREKLNEFVTSRFESRCPAIMCRRKLRGASVKVLPGRFTIIALNRNALNQSKSMQKVVLSPFMPISISQDPIAVISHSGSMASGHYVLDSKIGSDWYLNNDSRNLTRCQFSPFDQCHLNRETADIIVFENKH